MTAHNPIIPAKAAEFVEDAGVSQAKRVLADFAAAGLIKTYALAIETIDASGGRSVVRGSAIPSDLWQRIVRQDAVDDVWSGGTVRLPGSDLVGGEPSVSITGVGFNEKSLHGLVEQHLVSVQPPRKRAPAPKSEAPAPAAESPAASTSRQSRIPAPFTGSLDGELLTITEAKSVLRCGQTKLYALINSGRIERRDTGAGPRVTTRSVKAIAGIAD